MTAVRHGSLAAISRAPATTWVPACARLSAVSRWVRKLMLSA